MPYLADNFILQKVEEGTRVVFEFLRDKMGSKDIMKVMRSLKINSLEEQLKEPSRRRLRRDVNTG